MKIPGLARRSSSPAGWLALVVSLAGCSAPDPRPVRELFVEVRLQEGDDPQQPRGSLTAYPLDAESSEAYTAVRPLVATEGVAAIDSLYAALGDPAAGQLLFPSVEGTLRRVSAIYVGHAAFVHEREVWHHLRLLVVNRLGHDLLLPLERLVFEAPSDPVFVVAANQSGERVDEAWFVAPGEGRVVHLFYRAPGVDPQLRLTWELQAPPGPEGAPAEVGPWRFDVELRRHFLLPPTSLSLLERRVVLGESLPAARRPASPWAEPLLTPVPGPPAESGGGEGAGG